MILIGEYRSSRSIALDVASPDRLLCYQDDAGDLMVLTLRMGFFTHLDIQETVPTCNDWQVILVGLIFRFCRKKLHALSATGQRVPAVIDELHH